MYTDHQIAGKGQRGNIWLDEPGKNILMSLFLKPRTLKVSEQFYLNLIAGLAVIDALDHVSKGKKELKWPNDIYVNHKKIGGILIETYLKGATLESAIVGLGFNLNQMGFNLSTATSLAIETGVQFQREEIMELILLQLEKWYLMLKSGRKEEILEAYHKRLRWKDSKHEFKAEGELFIGIIQGIDHAGRLIVEKEDGDRNTYSIKEIEFVC